MVARRQRGPEARSRGPGLQLATLLIALQFGWLKCHTFPGKGAVGANNKICQAKMCLQSVNQLGVAGDVEGVVSSDSNITVFAKKEKQGSWGGCKSPGIRRSAARDQPAGKFQSKRLYPGGSFSPWKINLHLILLRNCSSQKQIESMRFIFF